MRSRFNHESLEVLKMRSARFGRKRAVGRGNLRSPGTGRNPQALTVTYEFTWGGNVSARDVAGCLVGRVCQDHDRELKSLRLVYGHHPHAFRSLLDDRRLARLPALGIIASDDALILPHHANPPDGI